MSKIKCEICGAEVHIIKKHLEQVHPGVTLEQYQEKYPSSPILSQAALKMIAEQQAQQGAQKAAAPAPAPAAPAAPAKPNTDYIGTAAFTEEKRFFHEVFGLGKVQAAMSSQTKGPIPMTVLTNVGQPELIPAIDERYVFDIDELKNAMLAIEMRLNLYVYGHKGAGKTELIEQIAARTGRPLVRVQHTMNTEEAHVVGQWTVKGGETVFNLGPLPLAMMNGHIYLADEYDFALPSMTSVYQAVMEGKPLFIKDAPPELRVIKPHPNFRFVATGNTNGSGDETGLYQGTNVQNSANYDRFGMMIQKQYLPRAAEVKILMHHTRIDEEDAGRVVEFATLVRNAYRDGKISDTISPRTLISATKIAIARSSYRQGLSLSFTNKLSAIDRKVVEDIAQRIFANS